MILIIVFDMDGILFNNEMVVFDFNVNVIC